jgi:pimeloyl-ACP methyl ester carboxylesterase
MKRRVAAPEGPLSPASESLDSRRPLDRRALLAREEDAASTMVAWRHVGIVELTPAQARATLATGGIARQDAPPAEGRFPVVVIAGGPSYLSTTAELLATHGYLVAAPFRYDDQSNEIGSRHFTWWIENGVRDLEWALAELRGHPRADLTGVTALGHGGGGMLAMLLAMRSRAVTALINIDAGNFSSRSEAEKLTFYSPRLMTIPYLYIATASTRRTQDRFEDFVSMRFSERTEVVLQAADLRHHDLSDFGRAVTAPLGIRGEPQARVQQAFSDVQEIAVRFLLERHGGTTATPPFSPWLEMQAATGRLAATYYQRVAPAPTTVDVTASLSPSTLRELRDARLRDAEASLFETDSLVRIVSAAITRGDAALAADLAGFAAEVRPDTPLLLELSSRALEALGDRDGARDRAAACAAIAPGNDWRASGAVERCRLAAVRLGSKS